MNFFGLDEPGPGLVRGKPDPEVKLGVAHDPGIRIRKSLKAIKAQDDQKRLKTNPAQKITSLILILSLGILIHVGALLKNKRLF